VSNGRNASSLIHGMAMLSTDRTAESSDLMTGFAERTGLAAEGPKRRYLWTDAFAVCNFLALARATGEARYAELALRLIDQVHHTLGRHRSDDPRRGWISGLEESEGELHPTRGGLRIGKTLPERPRGVPFDERLEWDRDGQYFHYLTKWMHALDQASRATRDPRFNTWARELAETSHRAFVSGRRGGRRMVWKMSIDLSQPLVASMGQQDPLDGLITCLQLRATASGLRAPDQPSLAEAVFDFAALARGGLWASADPLGIGGLLIDACRVAQLPQEGALAGSDLLDALLAAALDGLQSFSRQGVLAQPASRRLAFRELGLAIGCGAIERIAHTAGSGVRARTGALARYAALGSAIESFWRDPEHRLDPSWTEHRDINDVMLATCLVPEGLLVLAPVG
jgi:hypothetical protein